MRSNNIKWNVSKIFVMSFRNRKEASKKRK